MEEHVLAVEPFIRALQNAKVAPKDLTSIITALSALIAACDRLPSKPATLAAKFTRHGYTLSVRIAATTTRQSKKPGKT